MLNIIQDVTNPIINSILKPIAAKFTKAKTTESNNNPVRRSAHTFAAIRLVVF